MRNEWWSCDGQGHAGSQDHVDAREPEGGRGKQRPYDNARAASGRGSVSPSPTLPLSHSVPMSLSGYTRRQVLMGGSLAAVGWAAREVSALADVAVSPNKDHARDVLVTVFLRGGMDGLSAIPPYAEDAYHRARPSLRVAAPNDLKADKYNRAIDLDGFFGLHPSLAPLLPFYRDGSLGIIHAIGSQDHTGSHFEAMATMERGLKGDSTGVASGWVARHLSSTEGENTSPLRAVAFTSLMPNSLRGATNATALESLSEFRLVLPDAGGGARHAEFRKALAGLYEGGKDAVSHAGRETLAVLDTLNRIDPAHYRPANGAAYPKSPMGDGLRQVACLVKGRVGLEAACLDRGGWDMHAGQNAGNWMATELKDVADCVSTFMRDMGPEMKGVTLVLMTEFGRRLNENYSLGTDHGRGSVMFVLGGGVVGGRVYRTWPGLQEGQLEPPGNLRVTTDYRNPLAEIVSKRLRNSNLAEVFPGYTPSPVGIMRPV